MMRKKQNPDEKHEDFVEFHEEDSRYGRIITIWGAPAPKPDFTFKLKIVLGFLQIVTNLDVGLEIQWPTKFKEFVNAFNPANLDFVKFSSVDCVRRPDYYDRMIVFAFAPPALIACVIFLYFIP